jgi:hypothetical protein
MQLGIKSIQDISMKKQALPIIGASIPTGLEAVKDFLKLKLGNIILTNLPDDKQEAREVMQFCNEQHVYVVLGEITQRGTFKKLHNLSFSKQNLEEITKLGGKYYLGRYAIGESGGVLYWPKAYTINRRAEKYENMPKCERADEAHETYVKYLKQFVNYERNEIGASKLFNVESSMLFNYQAEAGIDVFCLEMFPGDPYLVFPAIRGNARAFDKAWGTHIAMGWYGGIKFDELWLKRWKLSLYYSFLSGAEFIYPESGHYDYKKGRKDCVFEFDHPNMKTSRKILREFWQFSKLHQRPANGPKTSLAIVFGNHEGSPGIWNPYAWGQYENGEKWEAGPAEKGWDLLDSVNKAENCFSENLMGQQSFSGKPPLGQFDILPVESEIDKFKQYKCLIFIGWNTMTEEIYDKLIEYVRSGGHLLMWLPQLNAENKRGAEIKLFRNGDFSELFGVEIYGKEKADVRGVKYLRESSLDSCKFPYWGDIRDPACVGKMTPAKVKFSRKTAFPLCAFSEYSRENIEEIKSKPVLIENQLGKGHAWLVTAFEYPGDDGMRKYAESLLRTVFTGEQGELRLICSDSVKYSVYDSASGPVNYQILYILNTEFDVSQMVKIWLSGEMTEEIIVPPNEMRVVYIIDSLIVAPESRNSEIYSIEKNQNENKIIIEFYNFEKQLIEVFNLSCADLSVSINGSLSEIEPGKTGKIECERRINPEQQKFYEKDFLSEPEIELKNTKLPY